MGFPTLVPMTERVPKPQAEGPNLRNFDKNTRRFWPSPPHGKPMAHHGACPHLRSPLQVLTFFFVFQADSLDRKFEKPLKHHLDGYKTVVAVSIPSDLAAANLDTKYRIGTFIILRACTQGEESYHPADRAQ